VIEYNYRLEFLYWAVEYQRKTGFKLVLVYFLCQFQGQLT